MSCTLVALNPRSCKTCRPVSKSCSRTFGFTTYNMTGHLIFVKTYFERAEKWEILNEGIENHRQPVLYPHQYATEWAILDQVPNGLRAHPIVGILWQSW